MGPAKMPRQRHSTLRWSRVGRRRESVMVPGCRRGSRAPSSGSKSGRVRVSGQIARTIDSPCKSNDQFRYGCEENLNGVRPLLAARLEVSGDVVGGVVLGTDRGL
ncbi:hypothetical protein PIB30_015713 [Stylosanthes scabra]|uniref:Uncharacterized protein n=1 Tax=Stylosanthes scabra TaxID=79078 RepID=A0ABU6W5A8_9FABA|nr:hypothetical protein [Stylosanthes scabra]